MKIFKTKNFSILFALALSAGSGLIYEVVATNILFFYFTRSTYSISTVLSVFLFGLGLGSYIIYKTLKSIGDQKLFFGILQILIAFYGFLILSNLEGMIPRISDSGVFAASLIILLLPTLFLGSAFPLAAAIIKEKKDITGLVYSSDLVGAIFGTLAAGFWLIPLYGNRTATLVAVGFNLLSAAIIFQGRKRLIPAFLTFVMIALFFIFPGGFWPTGQGNVIFSVGSPFGEVKVEDSVLFVDSKWMCDYNTDEEIQNSALISGAFELFSKKDIDVLNIGLGCGVGLQRILNATENTKVDVVEINPQVVEATRKFSTILENPRVNLIIDDGLEYLRETDKKYDIIVLEVENPTVVHSSTLFTVEAFKIIEKSLTDDGVYSMFSYASKARFLDILAYSLKEVFGHVYFDGLFFISSNKKMPTEDYQTTTPFEINTVDRNTLTNAYAESLK